MNSSLNNPILLYDGVCGLCNRFVKFVLRNDLHGRFRFGSLQSDFASTIVHRHGLNPGNLDTVYDIENSGQSNERISARSDAIISVLRHIGGFWAAISIALRALPRWFRDCGYTAIASNRYRIFGKYESCLLPDEKDRDKFLDQ